MSKSRLNLTGRIGTPEERFWRKVTKTDSCWVWTGCLNQRGYGLFRVNHKTVAAHRFIFFVTNPQADRSLFVCHICDNPSCVNPNHLFLGTAQDNMDDMMKKGRHKTLSGESNSRTKYSDDIVSLIRNKPMSFKEASSLFGISKSQHNKIINNKERKTNAY